MYIKETLMTDSELIAQEKDFPGFGSMLACAVEADDCTQSLKKYLGKNKREYRNAFIEGYFSVVS